MWSFIDDSGSFSWHSKGVSLFCGVTVSDAELPKLEQRFLQWKSSIIGHSKRELKGQELTGDDLYTFARDVMPATARDICLTLAGGDTSVTCEKHVLALRHQASELFRLTSDLCRKQNNKRLAESYREMSGWVRNRSTANILWIIVLLQTIFDSLQHSIFRFAEAEYNSEFENLEFAIDRSFVHREQHCAFWREWLRCDLAKPSRAGTIMTIKQWPSTHPFNRKYRVHKALLDFHDLFHEHTDFHNSKTMIGLQVADICANAFYRIFRHDLDTRAFDILMPRAVWQNGTVLHAVSVDDRSLHKDDLANHVSSVDAEKWKRRADEVAAKSQTAHS